MKTTKLVSGLMAMAMAAMSLTTVASAADVSVKVGSAEIESGASFSVDVDLSSVPSGGINAVDFAISYDSSIVKISDVSLGSIGNTGAASAEGDMGDTVFSWYDAGSQIVIIWATGVDDSSKWIKSNGTFLTIKGSAVGEGTSDLKIVPVSRDSYPGSGSKNADVVFSAAGSADYGYSATNGAIKVGSAEEIMLGDVDCDGKIKIADVVLLSRYVNEEAVNITKTGLKNSEVSGDGQIGTDDVTLILKYIARLINKF